MASRWSQNRHPLACKFCLRIQESLSVHLRRSCMKGAKPEEIDRLVSEARVNMRQILKGLSVVEYDDLDCKESDPQEFFVQFLEKNGCYIRGKPVQPARNIVSLSEETNKEEPELISMTEAVGSPDLSTDGKEEDVSVTEEEEMETHGPDEGLDCDEMKLQRRMKESGMYRKHPENSNILVGFQEYLRTWFEKNCIEGVANVARFLYFMDPSKPSLNFLYDLQKTNDFFEKLKSLGSKATTLLDYLIHIQLFVHYHQAKLKNDTHMHDRCRYFLRATESTLRRIHKGFAEEAKEKQYRLLFGEAKSPEEHEWIRLYRQQALKRVFACADFVNEYMSGSRPSKLGFEWFRSCRRRTRKTLFECAEFVKRFRSESRPSTSRYEDGSAVTPVIKNTGEKEQIEVRAVTEGSREDAFNKFIEVYPLNIDSNPPKLKKGVAFSTVHGHYCYDKWRKEQNKMRVDHITGHLKTRFPKEEEVKRMIQSKGWKLNLPRLKDIMKNCKAQLR